MLRNRATPFVLVCHTNSTRGFYSLPLSLPEFGQHEALTAALIGTGCFYGFLCLKLKHLAVPMHSDQLSPAKVTPLPR